MCKIKNQYPKIKQNCIYYKLYLQEKIFGMIQNKNERVGNPYLCGTDFESDWLKSTKHAKTSHTSKIINFEDIIRIQNDFIF